MGQAAMAMVQEPTGELPAIAESDAVADADLVIRAAAGGTDAFGELYRRHVDAAWRVAHAVTGNPEDAADAVASGRWSRASRSFGLVGLRCDG